MNNKLHCHSLFKLFIIYIFFNEPIIVSGVVVNDIKLLSQTGKTDYVLTGESYHLTCLYMLEPKEVVLFVQWDLNSRVIYVHKTDMAKPVASGIFADRVDYTSKSTNSISIRNATTLMAGKYSCHVFTNLTSTAVTISRQIYIIQDSCTQQEWKTHSDMINCREQISMTCMIYPKPISACALYNDFTGSIIKVETISRLYANKDHSYSLNVFVNYDVNEIKSLNVPVSFRCKLAVEGTTFKKLFVHSLFAESICLLENEKNSIKSFLQKKPMNNYLFNESEVSVLNRENACLIGYREGSIIKVNCISNNPLLLCVNASWTLIDQTDSNNLNTKLIKKEKIDWTKLTLSRDANVRCGSCNRYLSSMNLIVCIILLNYLLIITK